MAVECGRKIVEGKIRAKQDPDGTLVLKVPTACLECLLIVDPLKVTTRVVDEQRIPLLLNEIAERPRSQFIAKVASAGIQAFRRQCQQARENSS